MAKLIDVGLEKRRS